MLYDRITVLLVSTFFPPEHCSRKFTDVLPHLKPLGLRVSVALNKAA